MRMGTAAHLLAGGLIAEGAGGFCTCPTLADMSREHTFRPADGFCTCNDCSEHGTCCHLLAAAQLERFRDTELLTGVPVPPGEEEKVGGHSGLHARGRLHAGGRVCRLLHRTCAPPQRPSTPSHLHPRPTCPQRIEINVARTFQQPTIEPLGDDWHAEVANLRKGREEASAAIQQAQTNADPELAQLRSDAAGVQRAFKALPDGEARQVLLQRSAALRAEAEQLAAAAGLQPTAVRAGKQQRRREGRNDEDKVVKALQPWRSSSKRRRSGVPAQEVAPENRCDPLPTLTKKGIAVHKVRACSGQAGRHAECRGDEQRR